MATPATDCAIVGTINGKTIETPARALDEHVTALEDAAHLLGLPAFSEETSHRIDANTAHVYTRAHRWFPGAGETLRVHPLPLTAETVTAYAELVMSAGRVFEIENLEVVVA